MKSFRYCCGDMACFTRHTHYPNLVVQGSRKVWKSDRADKNVVGILNLPPPPGSAKIWGPMATPPTHIALRFLRPWVCMFYIHKSVLFAAFSFHLLCPFKIISWGPRLTGQSPVWCVCRVFKEKKPIITLMDVKKILEYSSENMGVMGFSSINRKSEIN